MKRRLTVLAVVAAACLSLAGLSEQASADPSHAGGHNQLVRSPDGQPAKVVHGRQLKGRHGAANDAPPVVTAPSTAGAGCPLGASGQYFCHAGGYQYVTSDGAYMSTPVESPVVTSGDYHSLAELAVESSDGQQIIEIGWTVDPTQWDQQPRLFVFHWVNGVGSCYNACGYLSNSSTITPGMVLTPSSTPVQFAIEHYQGNWWYGYNGTWFGYLPDSIWNGSYVQSGLIQEFGEVAAGSTQPCTNMGDGYLASNSAAAAVTGVGYYNTTTAPSLTSTMDDSTLYSSQITSSNSFRYGGPGAC